MNDVPPAASWTAVALQLPDSVADDFIGRMLGYTRGIRQESVGNGTCQLWVYLRAVVPPETARQSAEAHLNSLELDPRACALRLERVEDGHWVERYQSSLKPFLLGSRFLACPSGTVPDDADPTREVLLLVPGRAFGTGEHPTTQLCVERLEESVRPGSRWFDVGCGTAVLSITARRCGAAHVLALDDDPDAVEVAREVLGRNDVDGVDVRHADGQVWSGERRDGVVANIGAPFFREASETIAGLLEPGGLLIASGILVADLDDLEPRFESAGFERVGVESRGPWAVYVARKVG